HALQMSSREIRLPAGPRVDVEVKLPHRVQRRVDVDLMMGEHRSVTINARRSAHRTSSPRHPGCSTTALAPAFPTPTACHGQTRSPELPRSVTAGTHS